MATIKVTMLLPLRDNDDRPLSAEIVAVRDALFDLCDGWTSEGSVTGAYRMADGSIKIDVSAKFAAIIDDTQLEALERVVLNFKAKTTQEALLLEIYRAVEIRFV